MEIIKEIKHIKGLSEVLKILANEIETRRCFDKEDLELLKKIGTDILWKGVTLDFLDFKEK